MGFLQALFDILLPAECLLCDTEPKVLCKSCEDSLQTGFLEVERSDPGGSETPIWGTAATEYSESAAKIIAAFKEKHIFSMAEPLAISMIKALAQSGFAERWANQGSPPIVMVPIPSTNKSKFRRGFVPAQLLAKNIFRILPKHLPELQSRMTISRGLAVRERSDQSTLTRESRFEVSRHSMTFFDRIQSGAMVLIVDDLVTTGASILEARRAILEAQVSPNSHSTNFEFLTFAETKLKLVTAGSKKV